MDDKPATMPKIRRQNGAVGNGDMAGSAARYWSSAAGKQSRYNLPPTLLHHLLDRIHSREISASQLGSFAEWLDTEPEVPNEKWFRRFPGMIVCGEGDLVKTFLTAGQVPTGKEMVP